MRRITKRTWGDNGKEYILLDERTTVCHDPPTTAHPGMIFSVIACGIIGGIIVFTLLSSK